MYVPMPKSCSFRASMPIRTSAVYRTIPRQGSHGWISRPSGADTAAAAAPTRDGASRRTPAGSGGRRPAARRARRRVTARAGATICDRGREQDPRRPRARIAAQKSTSSVYRKNRSSSRPTASASARRTSRHAPLTQSTNRSRRSAARRRRPMATRGRRAARRIFCRSSFSGEIIGPNDSSTRPAPSTSRGPATARVRQASSRSTSRSIAPAGTIVSLLRSSSRFAAARADAGVVARRQIPTLRTSAIVRTPGDAARRLDAAVGRGVVDDDDLVLDAGGASRQRSQAAPPDPRCALKLTMMIETSVTRGRRHVRWPPAFSRPRSSQDTAPSTAGACARNARRRAGSSSRRGNRLRRRRARCHADRRTTPHRRTPRARSACP